MSLLPHSGDESVTDCKTCPSLADSIVKKAVLIASHVMSATALPCSRGVGKAEFTASFFMIEAT
eukprot:1113409-Rhodomonas_salina.2